MPFNHPDLIDLQDILRDWQVNSRIWISTLQLLHQWQGLKNRWPRILWRITQITPCYQGGLAMLRGVKHSLFSMEMEVAIYTMSDIIQLLCKESFCPTFWCSWVASQIVLPECLVAQPRLFWIQESCFSLACSLYIPSSEYTPLYNPCAASLLHQDICCVISLDLSLNGLQK